MVFLGHPDHSSVLATSHNKVESSPDSTVNFLGSRHSMFAPVLSGFR